MSNPIRINKQSAKGQYKSNKDKQTSTHSTEETSKGKSFPAPEQNGSKDNPRRKEERQKEATKDGANEEGWEGGRKEVTGEGRHVSSYSTIVIITCQNIIMIFCSFSPLFITFYIHHIFHFHPSHHFHQIFMHVFHLVASFIIKPRWTNRFPGFTLFKIFKSFLIISNHFYSFYDFHFHHISSFLWCFMVAHSVSCSVIIVHSIHMTHQFPWFFLLHGFHLQVIICRHFHNCSSFLCFLNVFS